LCVSGAPGDSAGISRAIDEIAERPQRQETAPSTRVFLLAAQQFSPGLTATGIGPVFPLAALEREACTRRRHANSRNGRQLAVAFFKSCRWIGALPGAQPTDRFLRPPIFISTPANGR